MKRTFFLLCTFAVLQFCLLLTSCKDSGRQLTSATGSIYECLIVAPETPLTQDEVRLIADRRLGQTGGAYDTDITNLQELLAATMGEPTPGLPQMEPYFKLTTLRPAAFDDFLKPTRNVLIADIDPHRYTQVKAKYLTDQYSTPQAVVRLQAPDASSLITWWLDHGEEVRSWLVSEELRRAVSFLKHGTNDRARTALQRRIGVDMWIPSDYELIMDTTDFVWCCNNKGSMRKDLVVWKYPYTDANTFTSEYLSNRRDEILGRYVSATVEGSHMGTEYKVFPPAYTQIRSLDPKQNSDFYAGELRGLWKMKDGEAMGGPFVEHIRIDEVNRNVITAEAFVFAPGQKKRSALRGAEAVLYTLTLPQDINRLDEVEVR